MTDDGASDDEPFSMVATMAAVFAAALSLSIGRWLLWNFTGRVREKGIMKRRGWGRVAPNCSRPPGLRDPAQRRGGVGVRVPGFNSEFIIIVYSGHATHEDAG
jgi:hypothetical protein